MGGRCRTMIILNRKSKLFFILIIIAPLVFWGCSKRKQTQTQPSTTNTQAPPPLAIQFSNIPIPKNYSLDRDRTFIYESGSGNVKVGRLYFYVKSSSEDLVEFYRNEMLQKGWKLIRIIEHDGTVMLYENPKELCTVIVSHSFAKTRAEVQVGPK